MAQRAWKSEAAKASRAARTGSERDLPESVGKSTQVLDQRAARGGKSQGEQLLRVFGRTGELMRNTSQTFFVLTILQFSLRDGNVYYDVMCGT